MTRSPIAISPLIVGCFLSASAAAAPQAVNDPGSFESVYYDTLDENGNLTGGKVDMWVPTRHAPVAVTPATSTMLMSFGPTNPANRIDFVFVGDGYTAAQLATYATQVTTVTNSFFNKVPYSTYRNYFQVHRVDVVSTDSGVDNDPSQGILKNTALDMKYWCNGTERLLCVNVNKAYSFANNAPDVDLVAALANSSMYGGAGYPSNDLGTCAAGNGSSVQIMQHEFGHALGNLADEYDYGGPATYTGAEPSDINASKLASAAMTAANSKWTRWLGTNISSQDGLVSTFEGCAYSQFGVYRPSNNSLMRNLGRPFNPPSIEKLIIEIYKKVDPIDASSDDTIVYNGSETLFVTPMSPVGHSLGIQWSLDGVPIAGATAMTFDLSTLNLTGCDSTVSVTVTDSTTLVRDEIARASYMTQSIDFLVSPGGTPISTYCSTSPNSVGPGALIGWQGTSSVAANDLVLRVTGTPPFASGFFFYGLGSADPIPVGNGWGCVQGPFVRLLPMTMASAGGVNTRTFDVNAPPFVAAPNVELYFQYWYRNAAAGGAGFNASDALRVRFCP
jgi:hypothetical protein